MTYKNYYDILGIAKDAPEKDIKSAYRRLAKKWHPDANPDNQKAAEDKFKDIQEAHEVLSDPEKRRKYDVLGNDWQQASRSAEQQRTYRGAQDLGGANFGAGPGAAGASGFSDFFDAFFSGIGRRGGPQPSQFQQRGQDLETSLDLTLAETYNGGKKSVSLQIDDACSRCNGTGTERGRICTQCHGTGRLLQTKKFDVTIPKGVREGQRIRLAAQGGQGVGGGPRGDLFLVVNILEDAQYQRKGDDLYLDLPVSIYDLALGGDVAVPTMTGDVSMTIPAGTQSNKMLRLTGKGMPHVKTAGNGDQYVRLIGMLPTPLSEKELKLFGELAKLRNGNKK